MISGVAQLMGMKPIFRLVFSSGPRSSAIACSDVSGSTLEMAAIAVPTPTAWRKRRRVTSLGKSARTAAASTKSCDSISRSRERASRACSAARSCASGLSCFPQAQPVSVACSE